MAKLFSKEKDIVLKVINSILVIWLIAAIVITFGVGIRIFNKDVTLSYSDYSKSNTLSVFFMNLILHCIQFHRIRSLL
ncbi:MAG: hypothetical protein BHW07_02210 [Clostridium sp. CAG_433_25_7]|nr:MAG: hypothetical protein BHW07_02210 [Clostridium sp. CAG_433_25_7]